MSTATLNLKTSPLSALVAEFNRLTGQSVKRFPDRAAAIKRLTAVLPKPVVKAEKRGVVSKFPAMKIVPLAPNNAREGTKRAAWLDALLSSKTVGEAQSKVPGIDSGVIRFAESAGFISLS